MQVNIPWQEPAIGAKPCPKCGKADPHYRHSAFYKETDAVCCGGEGCGFYQAATSREKALAKWNKALPKHRSPRLLAGMHFLKKKSTII